MNVSHSFCRYRVLGLVLLLLGLALPMRSVVAAPLGQILKGPQRSAAHRARDVFRHPQQTLAFFEVKPNMTVVEIWPGGGWYSEILAPMLKDKGRYIAAQFSPDSGVSFYTNMRKKYAHKLAADPQHYAAVKVTTFDPKKSLVIAPDGSADRVLTFRNVHNWTRGGDAEVLNAFQIFYRALKPGGMLGVVEHRLPETAKDSVQGVSGYMKVSYVKKIAREAGFKFVSSSEVNANPKDNADHPKGVWTLPPTYRLGKVERDKYRAIGESDRMTLKFVKPKK